MQSHKNRQSRTVFSKTSFPFVEYQRKKGQRDTSHYCCWIMLQSNEAGTWISFYMILTSLFCSHIHTWTSIPAATQPPYVTHFIWTFPCSGAFELDNHLLLNLCMNDIQATAGQHVLMCWCSTLLSVSCLYLRLVLFSSFLSSTACPVLFAFLNASVIVNCVIFELLLELR